MSPIGKIVLMVMVMLTVVDQSTSTSTASTSFQRLGAEKDNLVWAVRKTKRDLLSPLAGLARDVIETKNSIIQPVIRVKADLASAAREAIAFPGGGAACQ